MPDECETMLPNGSDLVADEITSRDLERNGILHPIQYYKPDIELTEQKSYYDRVRLVSFSAFLNFKSRGTVLYHTH